MSAPPGPAVPPAPGRRAFSRRDWAVTAVGISLALLLFIAGQGGAPPGEPMSFMITVVAPDATGLECAGEGGAGQPARCGLDAERRPVSMARPLRPFVTVGSELVLLTGVFEEEHVAAWLRAALARRSAERVTLDCQGPFLGRSGAVAVRFGPGSTWQPQRDVTVGRVERCRVVR